MRSLKDFLRVENENESSQGIFWELRMRMRVLKDFFESWEWEWDSQFFQKESPSLRVRTCIVSLRRQEIFGWKKHCFEGYQSITSIRLKFFRLNHCCGTKLTYSSSLTVIDTNFKFQLISLSFELAMNQMNNNDAPPGLIMREKRQALWQPIWLVRSMCAAAVFCDIRQNSTRLCRHFFLPQ